MNDEKSAKRVDRRKGPDKWVYAIRYFGITGWCLMLGALLIVDKAKPETDTFIDRKFFEKMDIPVVLRSTWDQDLAQYIFYLMILGCVLSIAGLTISTQRNRRKDDGYRIYLFTLALLSITGIALYIYKFIM